MTLAIEAVVRDGSEVADRTVEEISSQYGIIILSSQRNLGSSVERVNPNPKRAIKTGDRLEFKGETSRVMTLFEKCEKPEE
jgi:Trk K+ transport system NAD-binding subunit